MMNKKYDPGLVPGSDPDPASPDHAPILSATAARGGVTFGRMRWVLGLSVAGVAVAFLVIWLLTARG